MFLGPPGSFPPSVPSPGSPGSPGTPGNRGPPGPPGPKSPGNYEKDKNVGPPGPKSPGFGSGFGSGTPGSGNGFGSPAPGTPGSGNGIGFGGPSSPGKGSGAGSGNGFGNPAPGTPSKGSGQGFGHPGSGFGQGNGQGTPPVHSQIKSQAINKPTTPKPIRQRVDFGSGLSIAPGYGLPDEQKNTQQNQRNQIQENQKFNPKKPSISIQVDNKIPLESIQIPKTEPSPLQINQGFEIPSDDDDEG